MTIPSDHQEANQASWSLADWLNHLLSLHPKDIDMGLQRCVEVAKNLPLNFAQSTVITVAGTNGKGTTCTFIEQGCLQAGKSVGVYSSPHMLDYRERVRVNQEWLSEQAHCQAFLAIEKARGSTPLTYFEFGTLAGIYLLAQAKLDVVLLEVGLGGRLDATNIIDADVAVITSVDLDHQAFLGDTRELIGAEKAGIMRSEQTVIVGEHKPPQSIQAKAQSLGVMPKWQDQDFVYHANAEDWQWRDQDYSFCDLPLPHIPMQNASTGLAVLASLDIKLTQAFVEQCVTQAVMTGRCQQISKQPDVLLDVAHNPHASQYLYAQIKKRNLAQLHLVVAMLSDKDISGTLAPFKEDLELAKQTSWYVANLHEPRGASAERLKSELTSQQKVVDFANVKSAYQAAIKQAGKEDLIVVFGSFFTVAQILSDKGIKGSNG